MQKLFAHNERVGENQQNLLRAIDILKLHGQFNLHIHSYNKKEGPINKEVLFRSANYIINTNAAFIINTI